MALAIQRGRARKLGWMVLKPFTYEGAVNLKRQTSTAVIGVESYWSQMKKSIVPLLLIAFVVALACTGLFYFLVVGRNSSASQTSVKQQILVAAKKLPRGTVLTKDDVQSVPWSADVVPKGVLTVGASYESLRVVFPLEEGEPITTAKVTSPQTGEGAGLGIPVGMRAVSVRVFDSPGIIAMLQPGYQVDLQYVDNNRLESRTFLRQIHVLNVQAVFDPGSGKGPTAVLTLLVKPTDADAVSLADSNQRVRVLLRNPLEEATAPGALVSDAPGAAGVKAKVSSPATPLVARAH